ncbi:MAG TPA: phosphate ABC transporter permease subunit PstC [Patescibacteria group bacterium]|nr:phosphate ABC transporter permease subunit PstC [Patescibacteria group bacterium]
MTESREEVLKNPAPINIQKRKRYLGETIAETTIKVTASFSILLIFLIFIFVFKEAASLFSTSTDETPATENVSTPTETPATAPEDDLKPEVYNPETDLLLEENQHRASGVAATDDLKPEVYNPETDLLLEESQATATTTGEAPESYGADITESPTGETSGETKTEENPDEAESYNPEVEDMPLPTVGNDPQVEEPEEVAPKTIWHNLLGTIWQPVSEIPKFGLLPLLVGTAKATLISILIGAPLGILAAIYVALFANRRVREIVKPAIELLASFPSVVIGFFCMMTLATIVQNLFGADYRLNALVGGLGLAIAIVPIIFTLTEDALSSVPGTLREASLALGATEWETAFKVILPAATPGVFAAVLLGIGRAFGETMIALMATGNAALATWTILDPIRTFAATIGAEMGEVVWGSEHYSILFFLGVLLFIFTFAMNAITEIYVKQRLIKRFQGS